MSDTTAAADTTTETTNAAETAAQGAETAQTTAADTPTTETQQPEQAQTNVWDDPDAARAEIERLRRENASERVNAKQTAAEEARQQLLKDLGLVKDEEQADPAELKQRLETKDSELADTRRELAVRRAAGTKYDADALLDSRSFLESIKTIDPTDTDAIAAALEGAVRTNPRLKASQAAAVGGADIAGGAGQSRTYTRAQLADPAFFQANKSDILAALSEGRIRE